MSDDKTGEVRILEAQIEGLSGLMQAGFEDLGRRIDDSKEAYAGLKEELGRTRASNAKRIEALSDSTSGEIKTLATRITALEFGAERAKTRMAMIVGAVGVVSGGGSTVLAQLLGAG